MPKSEKGTPWDIALGDKSVGCVSRICRHLEVIGETYGTVAWWMSMYSYGQWKASGARSVT